jgi:WD40 repeat protein
VIGTRSLAFTGAISFLCLGVQGCGGSQPSLLGAEPQHRQTSTEGDPLPAHALMRFGNLHFRHPRTIDNSALSPDGRFLATAGGRSLRIWNLETGRCVQEFSKGGFESFYCPGLSFSPDGDRVAYMQPDFGCVIDLKNNKHVWQSQLRRAYGFCQFTPDGQEVVVDVVDKFVFWDLQAGKVSHTIPVDYISLLSPDAKTFVKVVEGDEVILGDVKTGKEKGRWKVATGQNGVEMGVCFSPDGQELAIVQRDKEVQFRNVASGKIRIAWPMPRAADKPQNSSIGEYRMNFSRDGNVLVMGAGAPPKKARVHVWDVRTGEELAAFTAHLGRVSSLHPLPDGKTLVTTGDDGLIRRWELATGKEISEPGGYAGRTLASVSADGRLVAVADERGLVDLWETTGGQRRQRLRSTGPALTSVFFSPDGMFLAAGQSDQTMQLWNVVSGKPGRLVHWNKKERTLARSLSFTADGKRLLAVGSSAMWFWDIPTEKTLWERGGDEAAVLSPDGKRVIAGAGGGHLVTLDANTGEQLSKTYLMSPKETRVRSLAISPDGRLVAVSLYDGSLLLRDGVTFAELRRVPEAGKPKDKGRVGMRDNTYGRDALNTLAFSRDGRWLISGNEEGEVFVWEVASGNRILTLDAHESTVNGVGFAPGMRMAFSSGQDGQAFWWGLAPVKGPSVPIAKLWASLAGEPAEAYSATWALIDRGQESVDFFVKKIVPVPSVKEVLLAKHIGALGSEDFKVRDAATKALADLGDVAAPALRKAMIKPATLEMQRRLTNLLKALSREPTPIEFRSVRAIQILEIIGSPDSQRLLRQLAGGAPGSKVTREAETALNRLRPK